MNSDVFSSIWWRRVGEVTIEKALVVLLIISLVLLARYLLRRAIDLAIIPPWTRDRLGVQQRNRLTTLQDILKSIVGYLLLFIGGIQVIKTIGGPRYDITPIITTAGVTGIAIGFGAQKLVRDTIGGFFVLLEDQYAVGDYVTINDVTGVVEAVGMRITRIRDDQGRLTMLSNGDIAKVTNFSRGSFDSYVEVGIGAGADISAVTDVLSAALEGFEADGLLEPPAIQGISSFDSVRTLLRVSVRAEPTVQATVHAKLREHIRSALLASDTPLA